MEFVALVVWLWIAGGIPATVLGEVVVSDSPRIAKAARIAFAFLLGVDLLIAAVVLSAGQSSTTAHMSRGLWWLTIAVAGIPLALVSGFAVRRGYTGGRRLALVVATLATAVLYLAFPLGFIPKTQTKLTGLGRFEHDHHLLGIAILLIPTLILLASELRWKLEVVAPEPESAPASLPPAWLGSRRRTLIGTAALVVILVWLAGTNGPGLVLGLGVVLAGSAVFLWRWHRSVMRSVRRDLKPPEQP